MQKINLLGLGSYENRSYFVFEKKKEFIILFSKFLESIGLDPLNAYYQLSEGDVDIEDYTDTADHVKNEFYDIDIFYGAKRIIVVIRSEIPRDRYIDKIKKIANFKGF